jgi:hypothetical protein
LCSSYLLHVLLFSAAKLAPKKWGLSGNSPYVLATFLGGVSFLLTQGVDVRPNLAAILGLATADALFLGGTCAAQISCFWPPYKRRILVHEAGHLLTGIASLQFLPTSLWSQALVTSDRLTASGSGVHFSKKVLL